MKPFRMLLTVMMAVAFALVGSNARATLKVVATTADLAAIARQVGGGAVEVTSLSLPTQDPHFVDAKPNLALALNKADLLLAQGLELEIGWLPVLQSGARNPAIQPGADGFLDCSSFVGVLEVPDGQVSRAQGDIHRGGNPHYLYDPRNGAKVGKGIAARLAKLDPAHAADFTKNAADLEKAAGELAAWAASRVGALDGAKRKVVVYHRSWVYLEAWLGLGEVGAVEPKPGIPPDPAHVAQLLGQMRAGGARAILAEEYYPQTTSKLLAEKTGAALLVVPGGTPEGQSYLAHVRDVTERVLSALAR